VAYRTARVESGRYLKDTTALKETKKTQVRVAQKTFWKGVGRSRESVGNKEHGARDQRNGSERPKEINVIIKPIEEKNKCSLRCHGADIFVGDSIRDANPRRY
jgi:hypothetical protein